jgi:hypothetical protein
MSMKSAPSSARHWASTRSRGRQLEEGPGAGDEPAPGICVEQRFSYADRIQSATRRSGRQRQHPCRISADVLCRCPRLSPRKSRTSGGRPAAPRGLKLPATYRDRPCFEIISDPWRSARAAPVGSPDRQRRRCRHPRYLEIMEHCWAGHQAFNQLHWRPVARNYQLPYTDLRKAAAVIQQFPPPTSILRAIGLRPRMAAGGVRPQPQPQISGLG